MGPDFLLIDFIVIRIIELRLKIKKHLIFCQFVTMFAIFSMFFRKNPQHRTDFSHPGDDDYDSDPNDDRLLCPFGDSCYRTNLDHRREFRHKGRPAPKPSKVNVNVNLQNGCAFCPHCNNRNIYRKPGYESDADSDAEFY